MPVDIAAVLTANIEEFKAKMAEADISMKTMTEHGASNMSKLQTIGKGAFIGLGVAAAGAGAAALLFGNQIEESQAGLQAALKAAGISWNSVKGSVDKTAASAVHYGFNQAQVEQALQLGIISTQNYASAHRNLGIAIDLAAARHIPLAQAMTIVDKAAIGQTRALKMMGIDLPVVATNALKVKQAQDAQASSQAALNLFLFAHHGAVEAGSKAYPAYLTLLGKAHAAHEKLTEAQHAGNEILDALSKRLKGQADAAAETFTGRLNAIKAGAENVAGSIGQRLIPILESLISVVTAVVTWLNRHRDVVLAVGIGIATVLLPALAAYVAEMAVAAAETIVALAPFIAIAAGIALVAFGIIELVKHWTTVWGEIKRVFDDAVKFLRSGFGTLALLILGPVGVLLFLALHWQQIWAGMQTVMQVAWTVIGPIFNLIKTAGIDIVSAAIVVFKSIWDFVWSGVKTDINAAWTVISFVISAIDFVVGGIGTVIQGMATIWNTAWSGLSGAVSVVWGVISPIISVMNTAIGGAVSALNGLISTAQKVGGFLSSVGGGIGKVLTLGFGAEGGPMTAGQPYIVGEKGPELFIPSASGTLIPNSGATTGGIAAGVGGGGAPVVVNLVINGQTFAQAISNDMWTAFLQKKRSVVTLNLT